MPIVTIQVTDEGVTQEQKSELIARTTNMLVDVLDKDPATTFVIIEEVNVANWGVAGITTHEFRKRQQTQQEK